MAAIGFPEHAKSVTLPSGTTYTYAYIPASKSKSTVLLLHGFPSSSWDWRHQIAHLSARGHGVLAPDLLGYGGSDKPNDPAAYTFKKVAAQLAELLDHEGLARVHAVGHDFGAGPLSRLINYHAARLLSASFLSVYYLPPARGMDIDAMKEATEEVLGFEKYGYQRFLARDRSWEVLEQHAAAAESLCYADEAWWLDHLYPAGRFEAFVAEDRRAPASRFVAPAELAVRRRIFAGGGYRGPTNWYRAHLGRLGVDEEERDAVDPAVACPLLLLTETEGPATEPYAVPATRRYAADCRVKMVGTIGHWLQLEARDEVNAALVEFFDEIDGRTASRL